MYNKELDNLRCRNYYNKNKDERKIKIKLYNNKIVECKKCKKEMKQNNLYYHNKKKCIMNNNLNDDDKVK